VAGSHPGGYRCRVRIVLVSALGFIAGPVPVVGCSDSGGTTPGSEATGGELSTGGTAPNTGGSPAPPAGGVAGHPGGGHPVPSGGAGASGGSGGAVTPPRDCAVVAPTECEDPALGYADVAPIFEARCVSCHDGQQGSHWPLNSYGHVATWRDTVRAALLSCRMPPVESGLDIPKDESERVLAWIRCGMKP